MTEWSITRSTGTSGLIFCGSPPSAISASVAAPSLEAGLLVKVDVPLPDRAFTVLRHAGRNSSRAASALMAIIEKSA